MSELNSEQKKAVEHTGGVLLKAGAGSGKTTVLIAHIVYLTQGWIEEFGNTHEGFEEFIRSKFAKVVMMTFTKKAAGEMNVRLYAKFETLATTEGPLQDKWQVCLSSLPMLSVTTIDGFTRKLITSGYFPSLSTEVSTIFDAERYEQVRTLFNAWFEIHEASITGEVKEIIYRESDKLLTAFRSIFNDSSLRLLWKEYDISQSSTEKIGAILLQSFILNGVDRALMAVHALDLPSEKDASTFENHVRNFQNTGLPEVDSVEKLKNYFDLFAVISQLRGQSAKTTTPAHEEAKEGLLSLRKWVREWKPVVEDYVQHYESKIVPWLKICKSLFDYVDQSLDPNQGMTFGDVEYFVALALGDKESRERINKQFTYFIVDEFQDTSALQFRIMRDLIGGDYKRLFCVGDPKQAIYGFRGGEISVFQNCEKLVPKVLTLANNYRSNPDVINFNNSLFRAVLPIGNNYIGLDTFPVEAEDQKVPEGKETPTRAGVEVIDIRLTETPEKKIKNHEIDKLEATKVAESIALSRQEAPSEVCAVLYKSIKKPSVHLIRLLMDKEIGFTAQYKINLMDDPLMGIFLVLLKRQFDRNEKTKSNYPELMFKSYLSILRLDIKVTNADFEKFDLDMQYWGVLEAFKKFVFRLGMTNENSDLNYIEIETLCRLHREDPEAILNQLRNIKTEVSLDFRFGKNPGMVQLMTTHASKGLEFDRVFICGLYTNGITPPDIEIFGNRPDSFKWYIDLATRQTQKSPMLVFEDELLKAKTFSESKRLFYVACTRAKKKLNWVDLAEAPLLIDRFQKNAWINALYLWENSDEGAKNAKLLNRIENPELNPEQVKVSGLAGSLPLFFYDSVGMIKKSGSPSELTLAAELSVTRLNSLIDCPRKFYFENILKLKTQDEVKLRPLAASDESETVVISSSERGSKIHEYISKGISENFIVHRDVFETEMKAPIQWALNELRGISSDHELISEKALKFKFFNFMISGIPDLIVSPLKPNNKTQVWDFKTGRITQENLSHYWIQLKTYAYALYELGRVPREETIQLRLCFVDQQKFVDMDVSLSSISPELFQLWRSQNEPWKTNPEHCSRCSYGTICHR